MKNFIKALLCLTTMLVLVSNSGSVYAAIAGRVQFVHGKVQLTTATGVTHAIKKGDAVNEGDTLISLRKPPPRKSGWKMAASSPCAPTPSSSSTVSYSMDSKTVLKGAFFHCSKEAFVLLPVWSGR